MQMTDVVNRRHMRHAHMVNITPEVMVEGMRADFNAVDRLSQVVLDKVRKAMGDVTRQPRKPVLLTSMDIRRYMRKIIEVECQDLPVLSYQELTTEIAVQPLAKVAL